MVFEEICMASTEWGGLYEAMQRLVYSGQKLS